MPNRRGKIQKYKLTPGVAIDSARGYKNKKEKQMEK